MDNISTDSSRKVGPRNIWHFFCSSFFSLYRPLNMKKPSPTEKKGKPVAAADKPKKKKQFTAEQLAEIREIAKQVYVEQTTKMLVS